MTLAGVFGAVNERAPFRPHRVGFEGAPGFVDQARELAEAARLAVEFVCGDVYDIGRAYARAFGLVTIAIGVLGRMPDLPRFFAVAAGPARPGGAFFVYEQPSIGEMSKPGEAGVPIVRELSYFSKEPRVERNGPDDEGGGKHAAKPAVSFSHAMAEIVMAGIGSGLAHQSVEEFPRRISNACWHVESSGLGLPMCYVLVFRKET